MPEQSTPPLSSAPTAAIPSAGKPYGWRDLRLAVGFLTVYVLLDWISFIEPFGRFSITPWEPASGLSVALVILSGRRHAALLVAAPMLAEVLVRGMPMPLITLLLISLAIGGIYTMAGLTLRWLMRRDPGPLTTLRNVVLLFVVAFASAVIVSLGEIGLLSSAALIHPPDLMLAIVREGVGEFIGVALTTPFVVLLMRRRLTLAWGMASPLLAVAGLLALIFSIPQVQPLQFFYLLFVPIIWMALTQGLEGAAIAAVATQLGLMLALSLVEERTAAVLSFQVLMIVLTVTGLLTGAAVSDRERAALRLRQLQDAQARFNRLGSMGTLSAVLAHEIRQPLTAAATYTRLALEALPEDDAPVRAHVQSVGVQVKRASDILRQMHDLVVVGRSSLAPVRADRLVQEALDLLRSQLDQAGVRLSVDVAPGPLVVLVDALQISQVIINLVSNAIEAMRADPARQAGARAIRMEVARGAPGWLVFRISDTGPGFTGEQLAAPITPLLTTRADGLGLGLALCQTIVHNHGGELRLDNGPLGGVVEFTLAEAVERHEKQAASRPDRG